ncbi:MULTISPECIES: hypothetical protein [Klebsiella]|uniref:hypothetical protein n=1 Tax=Klebsiella TaxID=570 RepID=UPI0003669E46|nr:MULTISPECIES: hypothetical protein [Klebsiella]MCP6176130.1 hypothetical protein [Klebsiella pneumoniae]MDW7500572.1 hypothetical protein [Klebsiella pneumoniae]
MMMIIVAVIAVLVLYAYWYACRASALDEKEKLSKVTIDYFNDDRAPSKMKDMAYFSYLCAGRWWFFSSVCILVPFVLLFTKDNQVESANKSIDKGENVNFQDVMNLIVSVNIKRHPLTSIFFAAIALLLATAAIFIRMIFGGIKKIPRFSSSILYAIVFMHTIRKKAHN